MTGRHPEADRLAVLAVIGEAHRGVRRPGLTTEDEAALVAFLRAQAGERADLLAEAAGLLAGVAEGGPDEALGRRAAQLCARAGADPDAIPAWAAEARRRRAGRRKPAGE
jgi:hypothetical protein